MPESWLEWLLTGAKKGTATVVISGLLAEPISYAIHRGDMPENREAIVKPITFGPPIEHTHENHSVRQPHRPFVTQSSTISDSGALATSFSS